MMGLFSHSFGKVGEVWDTINHPPLDQIDKALAKAETLLNWAGYIPVVSQLSGEMRYQLGQLEVIMAAAVGAFMQIKAKFTKNEESKKSLYEESNVYFQYCINGFGNMVKGRVEQAQMLYSVPMSIALAVYNLAGLRFNYPSEQVSAGQIPLLPSFFKASASTGIDAH